MEEFPAISRTNSDQFLSSKGLVVTEHELVNSTQKSQKPWQPLSFSSGILVPLAVFTAGLAAVLGALEWQNSRNGALLFASAGDTFSSMGNFLYRFSPTIIIVFYGIVWNWIDLDIKRLEPWFQLARTGGSSARTSLLLHYPVDFLPLVPFKAAQRRYSRPPLAERQPLTCTLSSKAVDSLERIHNYTPCRVGGDASPKWHLCQHHRSCAASSQCRNIRFLTSSRRSVVEAGLEHLAKCIFDSLVGTEYAGIHDY
jgi:hypothetical protein